MPIQDLNDLDTEQKQRLQNLALSTKALKEKPDMVNLTMEVSGDFSRTMNKIIFDKYIEEEEDDKDLTLNHLRLPSQIKNKEAPYLGMIPLERNAHSKDFTEIFKDFCFSSLYIKEEVIHALQEIKYECTKVVDMKLFDLLVSSPMRVEEFKHRQDSTTSVMLYHLKGPWAEELKNIVTRQFSGVGKGWFSITDTSQTTYDFGKLKRFLTLMRLEMQDVLLTVAKREFYAFYNLIEYYVPESVQVVKAATVHNTFKPDPKLPPEKDKRGALFQIDLIKHSHENKFMYSTSLEKIVDQICDVFENAVAGLGKVPVLEPKILPDLYSRTGKEAFIKAPMLRKNEAPPEPDPNEKPKKLPDENKWIYELYWKLRGLMQKAIKPLNAYLESFEAFKEILQLNPDNHVKLIENEENPRPVEAIREEILQLNQKIADLKKVIPEEIQVSCFVVSCKDLLHILITKYETLQKNLTDLIAKRARESTQAIFIQFNQIQAQVKTTPKDIEGLTRLKEYISDIPNKIEKIKVDINSCLDIYAMLDEFQYRFAADDLNKKWQIFGGPKDTMELVETRKVSLEKEKTKFHESMLVQQEEFRESLENLDKTISNFHQYSNLNHHEDVATTVKEINESLKQYETQARQYNQHEMLFGLELSDYSKISVMAKDFQQYSNLWLTANNWFKYSEHWLKCEWKDLDAPFAEQWMEERVGIMKQVINWLKNKNFPQVMAIAEKIRDQLNDFKPKVPLMVALRKEGMTDRHWDEIYQKTGIEVKPGEGFTFQTVLDLGLLAHTDKCVEIGERAAKEFAIETQLKKMLEEWKTVEFNITEYKNTKTFIIKGYDEIGALLDEHIQTTQAMSFSPFKKPFEEDIANWIKTLIEMSDILEEWSKVQSQWMYLQPIFDSPDIAKQLANASKRFKNVDSTWRHTMTAAKNIGNVLQMCKMQESTSSLLDKLQEANKTLEAIQKELTDYLERKREAFARFYFLSNDELLEILSQTKDPEAVQPHLRKVFENIFKVDFDAGKKITCMYSAENERIPFVKNIDTNNKNVEFWMGDLEEMMKISVRHVLHNSVEDYAKTPRGTWVLNHPGQCVLNGSQVHWTKEVETAITEGLGAVKAYFEKSTQQIHELVRLIRTKLGRQQQIAINALIVIDVHAKDVIQKLVDASINDIGAFEWISQLRYYWESDDCYVRCIQTNFPYGYEYLGNTMRLVITPLTDKCYMTLMGAIKLNLGGAPAGPAGTGKTESTKDLAKALAKQCVVFNCQEGMDHLFVGKFFKGLASSGAWCCFDEFNRINIEVLSVIAQQLQQLFGAKAAGITQIEFEESRIKVMPTFSVFITMNPGYAGRTELPDNLKALFRSVAMMVPDYALIGEIMLYSFGFETARELAQKMVTTFKLSSEQLSSQDHYDYGMRAVRSVINAAGLLKRQDPDMDEKLLLLRALRDVNVPKFLQDDLPLFENIITDLFPEVERPKIDYGALEAAMKEAAVSLKLQPVSNFITKIQQLYDTIQVRHGLMLVGPTGGGKTSNYQVLQRAMTSLAKEKIEGHTPVHVHVINPKAVTMGQLYGDTNEAKEWMDGVLAYTVRECCRDQSSDKHWVMFDGPVDALWIESMNTVLDDNKKLCLTSGQILVLTPYMTMMFEVEDLAVASPATVSRCGMVYMEPVSLGVTPLIDSWFQGLPESLNRVEGLKPKLRALFDAHVEDGIYFIKTNCKEPVQTMENSLAASLCRLMDCYLNAYKENEYKKVPMDDLEYLDSIIESIFIFSFIWSIGCTVDLEGRRKFSSWLRERIKSHNIPVELPEEGAVYDYNFDVAENQFTLWIERSKNFQVNPNLNFSSQFSEIVVPTNNYNRMLYLLETLIKNNIHVLCPGPTGTGKSLYADTLLTSVLKPEEFQYITMTFSAQTTANQTQDTIDSKMDKRRKGIYGPPTGKRCVIFVDDLNMPKKETYGAQPPIEILRQHMDHKGWYERKTIQFMKLEDLIFLSAMGPPGGGRSFISARMIRHFNMITYTDIDEETVSYIFSMILDSFLSKFLEPIRNLKSTLIETVLYTFEAVKRDLRPTPAKSFYTFNLRDISKVFQGICSSNPRYYVDPSQIVRLWYHENLRVFHDRLTTEEDRTFLKEILNSQLPKFKMTTEQVLNTERLIFGDFMQRRDADVKFYNQITDLNTLLNRMENYLEEYNADSSMGGNKKQMKLVMFLDACEHIARICRVLRQPQGNALLLGVGGSGRQSLSKMAIYISCYKLFQVEVVKGYNITRWREDLKKCLMIAGIENKAVAFLFVDTQIINEQMLEDINSILNTGDVPNLYKKEDLEAIDEACRHDCVKKGIEANKMNVFSAYLSRIRKNIHCIIAMSPLGETFHSRLRMFPSLINCSTLDWFTEWPEEALIGVGKGQLIEFEQELEIEKQSNELVEMFKRVHKSVEKVSVRFVQELRRYNYVTPTSYLELLNMFRSVLTQKRTELKSMIQRLVNGLEKLKQANEAVEVMQIDLKEKEPKLAAAEIETKEMMAKLEIDKKEASETQKIVAQGEIEAKKQAADAEATAARAQASVASAQIILDQTLEEINQLSQKHLTEVKSYTKPLRAIVLVLQAVVVLLGQDKEVPLVKVEGSTTNEKRKDYFGYAKINLLSSPQALLDGLKDFAINKKDKIPQDSIDIIKTRILPQEDFAKEKVDKSSDAAKYLRMWVMAMYNYHQIFQETQPLRAELEMKLKEKAESEALLAEKKAELEKVNATIKRLEDMYDAKVAESEALAQEIKDCQIKLDRAHQLTSGLKDEGERWKRDVQTLSTKGEYIPGDSVIAAAMIAYAGPFTSEFRKELESTWINFLAELNIKYTEGITMRGFLGNPVTLQAWNIAGLPRDDTSTENGIIIEKTRRWPLMIDPQTQANKFVKNLGRDNESGFQIQKASDGNLLKQIEYAIQYGRWILIENVGTELDPALEPVLLQQTFKQGGNVMINIGDKSILYPETFKLLMTTTLPNPHYPPETFVKVTIINFAITPKGLEEQMLAQIVALENPQLEQKKIEIVKKNAADRRELQMIEDSILKSLSESKGDFLMDEKLINQLKNSKKMSLDINQRVKDSKITEEQIDQAREAYRPVAYRSSRLFFCILDLANIDPMYQYSLQWFTNLFSLGVENAPASTQLEVRLKNLNEFFTYLLYENVCRSLFERHKLLFSLILAVKILEGDDLMNLEEWRYLLSGYGGEVKTPHNPTTWLDENTWPTVYRQFYGMESLPAYKGICEHLMKNPDDFRQIFDAVEAHEQPLPAPWQDKLDEFEKLIVLKALRPDKLKPSIQNWISGKLGKQFIEAPTFKLEKCFKDSSINTPLIFVLSAGSDPVADFMKFADEMGMLKRFDTISLGKGQGNKAKAMVEDFSQKGGWVLLQNCHLAITWMPELEVICENLNENLHKDFRIWLTSMPTPAFPVSVLQNGIKMTLEPPSGLRSNLLRSYENMDDAELNDCQKPDVFKKLLFGFCLFHAIIQERRKFGPIGWNIAYEFTNEDLGVCKKQLKLFLDEYKDIPYKVLNYIGAEINYGGRVTDDKDVRLIKTILKIYICPEVLLIIIHFS